jgi:hypothetical protein
MILQVARKTHQHLWKVEFCNAILCQCSDADASAIRAVWPD